MTPVDASLTRNSLSIAGLAVTEPPELLETLVGSCVAVVLWDETSRRGAMGHALLPESPAEFDGPAGKYVDTALVRMVHELSARGSPVANLTAKLVGGAKMFGRTNSLDIGRRNVEAARRALESQGIPLLASHTGGTLGRKVIFSPADGAVEIWNGPRLLETL